MLFVERRLQPGCEGVGLYKPEQITGRVTAAFSILAIFVSCLGLFGLATFSIGQRTKEIGIRKMLGASVRWPPSWPIVSRPLCYL